MHTHCTNCGNQRNGHGIYQCGRGHVCCTSCSTHSLENVIRGIVIHSFFMGIILIFQIIFGGGIGKALGDIGRTCPYCGSGVGFKGYIR